MLRTRQNVARGLFGVRPTAANVLVGPTPPLKGGDDNLAQSHHSQRSPQSPVTFSDGCFRPPSSVMDLSMSISASEKEEWEESERDRSDSEGPSDLQEELIRVLNKAVQELELAWNPQEEPAKSKLDSWYFRSSRRQVDTVPSTQRHRPCFLRWMGRKPTDMCACPPSRRLSLHICTLHWPKPWARISAYPPNHAG